MATDFKTSVVQEAGRFRFSRRQDARRRLRRRPQTSVLLLLGYITQESHLLRNEPIPQLLDPPKLLIPSKDRVAGRE